MFKRLYTPATMTCLMVLPHNSNLVAFSLVPRPRGKKKSGLVSTVRACARIYGIGSVNVPVNGLSHMPRSSTETVYGIVSERTKKQTFYN